MSLKRARCSATMSEEYPDRRSTFQRPYPFKQSPKNPKPRGFGVTLGKGVIQVTDHGSGQSINVFRGGTLHNVRSSIEGISFDVPGCRREPLVIDDDSMFFGDNVVVNRNVVVKRRKLQEQAKTGTDIPLPSLEKPEPAHEDQKDECRICMTNQKVITLVPCGHLCACYPCMQELYNRAFPEKFKCPCCNASVDKAVRTFV